MSTSSKLALATWRTLSCWKLSSGELLLFLFYTALSDEFTEALPFIYLTTYTLQPIALESVSDTREGTSQGWGGNPELNHCAGGGQGTKVIPDIPKQHTRRWLESTEIVFKKASPRV
jgi:hypothetical protein